ncbi:MAG: hypothetical protein HRT45_15685 [Bdellovibrionales bacterium]|nr:hypothetical protein [Bdellovibrionales bacterium]
MPIVGNLYSLLATPVEQWELSGLGLVGDEDHISYMTEEKYLSEPEPAVVGPVLTRLFEITNSSLEVAWRRTQSTPITSEQDRETALSQYSEVICNCMGVEEIIEITGEILSSELFADNLQSLSCMSLMM